MITLLSFFSWCILDQKNISHSLLNIRQGQRITAYWWLPVIIIMHHLLIPLYSSIAFSNIILLTVIIRFNWQMKCQICVFLSFNHATNSEMKEIRYVFIDHAVMNNHYCYVNLLLTFCYCFNFFRFTMGIKSNWKV